jgi:hypothetical protein
VTKTEYANYLAGEHWKNVREQMLGDWSGRCNRCAIPRWLAQLVYGQDLHLHHKHYRTLGHENPDDLEILCRRCHEIETFGRSNLAELPSFPCDGCGCKHWDRYSPYCPVCTSLFCSGVPEALDFSLRADIWGEPGWRHALQHLFDHAKKSSLFRELYESWGAMVRGSKQDG